MSQPPNRKEPFRASKLLRDALHKDVIKPGSRLRIARPLDAESLIGRHEGGRGPLSVGSKASVAAQLQKRIGSSRALASAVMRGRGRPRHFAFDGRQRAVVKLHYFSHAKGGAGALKAHARYIARDSAAKKPGLALEAERDEPSVGRREKLPPALRQHSGYRMHSRFSAWASEFGLGSGAWGGDCRCRHETSC